MLEHIFIFVIFKIENINDFFFNCMNIKYVWQFHMQTSIENINYFFKFGTIHV